MTKTALSRQYVSVGDAAHGTAEAFTELYEREADYVWRTLRRLGVAPADVDDAVHDVFVIVFRRWNELDRERSMRPWLFGVARKVAAAQRRRGDRKRELAHEPSDDAASPRKRAADRDLLERVLDVLPEERRLAFVLHDIEGYTGAEVGEILGVPMNTVFSRLRKAREELLAAVHRLTSRENRDE